MEKAKKFIFVLVTMLIMTCSSIVVMATTYTYSYTFGYCELGDTAAIQKTSVPDATYQWYRTATGNEEDTSDWVAISGATDASYTFSEDDLGYYVGVIVSSSCDYLRLSTPFCSSTIIHRKMRVSIGTSSVYMFPGCTLTAYVTPTAASDQVSYKWYRYSEGYSYVSTDEVKSKATLIAEDTDSYTATNDDIGYYIYVIAEGTGDYYGAIEEQKRLIITPYLVTRVNKSKDSIYNACPGTVLTALTYASGHRTDFVSYQWYAGESEDIEDATEISGANTDTYTVQDSDVYKYIFVKSTGTDDYANYDSGIACARINESADATTMVTSQLKESSTEVGGTIIAAASPEDATVIYTWYRDGEVIADNTTDTYTLTDDDIDATIMVRVAGTGDYYGFDYLTVGPITAKEETNTNTGTDNSNGTDTNTSTTNTSDPTTTSTNKNPTTSTSSIETTEKSGDDFNKEIYESGSKGDVEVYVSQGSMLTITIPKKVTLDGQTGEGTYKVTANYDIPSNQVLTVEPSVKEIDLKATGKKSIKATITQEKTTFSISEDGQDGVMNNRDADGAIKATNVSAGVWTGSFNFNIKVEGSTVSDSTASNETVDADL